MHLMVENISNKFLWAIGLILFISCTSSKITKQNTQENNATKVLNLETMKTLVYTTAHNSNFKLSISDSLNFLESKELQNIDASIIIDPTKEYQTFLGIGAALTDASAETYFKLPKENQRLFMEAYFDTEKGIGYTLARTSIHSCDFSTGSYTYVNEGDAELKTFSVDHDKKYRIPFIKKAIESAGGKLTLYASPWSPPAFMKSNKSMLQGGKLLPEFYQSWANYYAKFIKFYEAEGIPIWGLTIQNEPLAAQRWESCIYTAEEERDFLKNYLGPTLQKTGLGDKKIIVWDHNRDLLFERASTILNDPDASKYVWGSGIHWYEDWKDGIPMFNAVHQVNEAYPDKNLIFTEGCNESFNLDRIKNEDPKLAERYGKSMINDFNNGVVAWTDWNILLDETGGPNHVGNLCFSPMHANIKTGELIFTNSYYYIGHFSKFIRPGAKRITSASSSNYLLSTAFRNVDGSLAIVVMNSSNKNLDYSITLQSKAVYVKALPHSIQTILISSK